MQPRLSSSVIAIVLGLAVVSSLPACAQLAPVLLEPTTDQVIHQRLGTTLKVNHLNSVRFFPTDEFPTLQAAVNDLQGINCGAYSSNCGGTIYVLPGIHPVAQTVRISKRNIEIVGMGNVGAEVAGDWRYGTSNLQWEGTTSDPLLYFVPENSGELLFGGPSIRNLTLVNAAQAGYPTGIKIERFSNFLVENVAVHGFKTGIWLEGPPNDVIQYGTIANSGMFNPGALGRGLYMKNTSGIRVLNCHLDGNGNTGTVPADDSVGVVTEGNTGTGMFLGNVIQGFQTLVRLWAWGGYDQFIGNRLEIWKDYAIQIGPNAHGTHVVGGSLNNFLLCNRGTPYLFCGDASHGIGVYVSRGAQQTRVDVTNVFTANAPTHYDGNASSTSTAELNVNQVHHLPAAKEIYRGGVLQPRVVARVFTNNLNFVVAPNECQDVAVSVTGALEYDRVVLGPSHYAADGDPYRRNLVFTAVVSRSNTVKVRACNAGSSLTARFWAPFQIDVWR